MSKKSKEANVDLKKRLVIEDTFFCLFLFPLATAKL